MSESGILKSFIYLILLHYISTLKNYILPWLCMENFKKIKLLDQQDNIHNQQIYEDRPLSGPTHRPMGSRRSRTAA